MNVPSVLLKAIVLIHFTLSVFGSMGDPHLLPSAYIYVNAVVVACGLWAIASSESADAALMTAATLVSSIIIDIILLALYAPRADDYYTEYRFQTTASERNEYHFALGMSIFNLCLKPTSTFVLVRMYQSRNNNSDFSLPGFSNNSGTGGSSQYSNTGHQVPSAYNATSPREPAGSGEPVPQSYNA